MHIYSCFRYQNGPDTYLLQLRDVDLPCRLRHYMKVAAERHPVSSTDISEGHIDWRVCILKIVLTAFFFS